MQNALTGVMTMQSSPWANGVAPILSAPTDPRLNRPTDSMEAGTLDALVVVQQGSNVDPYMECRQGQHEQAACNLSCMQPLPPSTDWSKLQQRVSELRVAVAHWDTMCRDLKQQVMGLTSSLQDKHAENSYLQAQCAQVTQDLQLLLSATQHQAEDVQGHLVSGLRADLTDANQRCLDLEAELQALQFQLAETDAHAAAAVASERDERQRLASELGTLRLLLAARQRHLDAVQEQALQQQAVHTQELEERAQQAQEADQQLAHVSQQLADERVRAGQAEAAAEELRQQLQALQGVCVQQEQQLQAYSAQVSELQVAREWLEAAVADLQDGRSSSSGNLLQLHQALREGQAAQAALQARAEQAEALVLRLQQQQQQQADTSERVATAHQQQSVEAQGHIAAATAHGSQEASSMAWEQQAQGRAESEVQLRLWQERATHAEGLLQQQQQQQQQQPHAQKVEQEQVMRQQGSTTSSNVCGISCAWAAALTSCSDDEEEAQAQEGHPEAALACGAEGQCREQQGIVPLAVLPGTPGSTVTESHIAPSTRSYGSDSGHSGHTFMEAACQTDPEAEAGDLTLSSHHQPQEMAIERQLLRAAQEELSDLRAANQQLRDQLTSARSGMVAMEDVTKALQEARRLSASKLEQALAASGLVWSGRLREVSDAAAAAEAKAAAASEELAELQATRQALLAELQSARDEAAQLRQRLQEQEQQLQQVQLECESDTAAVLLDATSSSHAQLAAAAQHINALEQQLQAAHAKADELQQQVDSLQHDASSQVLELQQQLQVADTKADGLQQQLQMAGIKADGLQQQLQVADIKTGELQQQVEHLQHAASMQVYELQQQVSELQVLSAEGADHAAEELQAARAQAAELECRVMELQQKVAELEHAKAELLQQVSELEQISVHVAELQQQLQNGQVGREDEINLQQQVSVLHAEKSQCEEPIQQLDKQLQQTQHELQLQVQLQGCMQDSAYLAAEVVMCQASTQTLTSQMVSMSHAACQTTTAMSDVSTQVTPRSVQTIAADAVASQADDGDMQPMSTGAGDAGCRETRRGVLLQPEPEAHQQQQGGHWATAARLQQLQQLRASLCASIQSVALQPPRQHLEPFASCGADDVTHSTAAATGSIGAGSKSNKCDKCDHGHATPREPLVLEPPPPEASDSPNLPHASHPDEQPPQSPTRSPHHMPHASHGEQLPAAVHQAGNSLHGTGSCGSDNSQPLLHGLVCSPAASPMLQPELQADEASQGTQRRCQARATSHSSLAQGFAARLREEEQLTMASPERCSGQQDRAIQQQSDVMAQLQRWPTTGQHQRQAAVPARVGQSLGAVEFHMTSTTNHASAQRVTRSEVYQPRALVQAECLAGSSSCGSQGLGVTTAMFMQSSQHHLSHEWQPQAPSGPQEQVQATDQTCALQQAGLHWQQQEQYMAAEARCSHDTQHVQLQLPEQGSLALSDACHSDASLTNIGSGFRQQTTLQGFDNGERGADVVMAVQHSQQCSNVDHNDARHMLDDDEQCAVSQQPSIDALAEDISQALRQSRRHKQRSEAQEVAARRLVQQAGHGLGDACDSLQGSIEWGSGGKQHDAVQGSMELGSCGSRQTSSKQLPQLQKLQQQRPPLMPLSNQQTIQAALAQAANQQQEHYQRKCQQQQQHHQQQQHRRDGRSAGSMKPRQSQHLHAHLMGVLDCVEENLVAAAAPRAEQLHRPCLNEPAAVLHPAAKPKACSHKGQRDQYGSALARHGTARLSAASSGQQGLHGSVTTLWNLPPPSSSFDDSARVAEHPDLELRGYAADYREAGRAAMTVSLSSLRMSDATSQQCLAATKPELVANRRYLRDV